MRHLAAILIAPALMAGAAQAERLPSRLEARVAEGVQACVRFYEHGETIATLGATGFTPKGRRSMETRVDLSDQGGRKRPYFVRVLIENGDECEVHSDYRKGDAERQAFDLAKRTVAAAGFTTLRNPRFGSKAKTIFAKGTVSMWFKTRERDGKVMVKFLERKVGK